MKNKKKAISIFLTTCMALSVTASISAFAAATDPNISTVIGIKADSVMLSNGCVLSQKDFRKYSGEDFDLEYGDVVSVTGAAIEPIAPGYYALAEQSEITYLGPCAEYYVDNTKCLTVTNVMPSGEKVMFKGEDGTIYQWLTNNKSIDYFGYTSEIDPCTFEVGDTVDCTIKTVEYYVGDMLCFREDVVLPLKGIKTMQDVQQKPSIESSEIMYGDINGNGTVDVLDVIIINKHILGGCSLSEPQRAAADVNADGQIDSMDSLTILKHIVGVGSTF